MGQLPVIPFIRLYPDARPPTRASNGAIGFDAYAYHVLDEKKQHVSDLPYTLPPGEKVLLGIGVSFAINWPYECQVRPRSGLANKHDIELSNSPGTVDPDFRGEVGVLLRNRGNKPFVIEKGMRVAQLIFSSVEIPVFREVEKLPPTRRGAGGFGSTGLQEILEGTSDYDNEIRQLDAFYMKMAVAASDRSTCARGCQKDADGHYLRDERGCLIGQTRKFGCVIVKNDNVISIGYNTQAPGRPDCRKVGCLREAEGIPSGQRIERCHAIHAEQHAFLRMLSSGVGASTQGATIYVTAEPCEVCAKEIAGSGVEILVILKGVYPNNGLQIIRDAGIDIREVDPKDLAA